MNYQSTDAFAGGYQKTVLQSGTKSRKYQSITGGLNSYFYSLSPFFLFLLDGGWSQAFLLSLWSAERWILLCVFRLLAKSVL